VPYEKRGRRFDEAIDALRELWQPGFRSFAGDFYSFTNCESKPDPLTPGGPPIVIGGSTPAAARRAGRVGDGLFPYVVSPDTLAELLAIARASAVEHGRDPAALEVTAWPGCWQPGSALDPAVLRDFVQAGANRLMVSAQESGSSDIDGVRDFLRRMQDDAISAI